MPSSWWWDIIVVETDREGNWPASWNLFWAIFILLSFFTSLYALLLLYHRHDKWCKLREARRWAYSTVETIHSPLEDAGCCRPPGASPPTLTALLLCQPLPFTYTFWPCFVAEKRNIQVHCATLWWIADACDIYAGVKPIQLACTKDNSLCVTLSKKKEDCGSGDGDCTKMLLTYRLRTDNHNKHYFFALVKLLNTVCGTAVVLPSGGVLRLDLVFTTNNSECSSVSSHSTFSSLSDSHVRHRLSLFGYPP